MARETMTHIDLFSGIGGFAYAAKQVWPDYHNLFFCDTNKFCQAVLRKNFGKDILIYDDISEVTVERFIADTELRGRIHGEPEIKPAKGHDSALREPFTSVQSPCLSVDLLTGGFPCQPFSAAGKRKGNKDDRYLWPQMLRIIQEFKPRWIVGENVAGIQSIFQYESTSPLDGKKYTTREDAEADNNRVLERTGTNELYLVVADIERLGYEVQVFCLPACAVNAPHRRDRVWIVANSGSINKPISIQQWGQDETQDKNIDRENRHAADASHKGLQRSKREQPIRLFGQSDRSGGHEEPNWNQNWLEVATHLCRVDDGLSAGVDGLKLSKSKHREERLKALGNAIVPQVVMEIMKVIKEAV